VKEYVIDFKSLGMGDVAQVGGKNASLGEMVSHLAAVGVQVPGGFATTAAAFNEFLEQGGLKARIDACLEQLDVDDVDTLAKTGAAIRQWILDTPLPEPLNQAISSAYAAMVASTSGAFSVAVRSSATAEDLPDASFAGQQETFLNVNG